MFRTIDPFREFSTLASPTVDYDIVRSEDGVQLSVDIPGIDPATVDLSVDGRSLSLKAERDFNIPEGSTLVSRRRRPGTITHSFQLSEQLDADRLEADYAFGVLTVTIPMAESARPRKVEVGVGEQPTLDAS